MRRATQGFCATGTEDIENFTNMFMPLGNSEIVMRGPVGIQDNSSIYKQHLGGFQQSVMLHHMDTMLQFNPIFIYIAHVYNKSHHMTLNTYYQLSLLSNMTLQ